MLSVFCVFTIRDDKPHTSLVAFTSFKGLRQLMITTYRNTKKFLNLKANGKVAVLIEGINEEKSRIQDGFEITAPS